MKSTDRSRLAAVAVFVLIALVVIGNMTWATLSSFTLARKRVTEDYERKVAAAVADLNNYMAGILNSETARDHRDYIRHHYRVPQGAYAQNGDVDVEYVRLLSPLALRDPPHDWIDVYFQLGHNPENTDFVLSSPQIEDESVPWHDASPPVSARTRQTWAWLKTALSEVDLREKVAEACTGEHAFAVADRSTPEPESPQARRRKRLRNDQLNYLPPAVCIDAGIAERNIRSLQELGGVVGRFAKGYAGEIEIKPDPIAMPFWLGLGPNGGGKLAFVRECHWGDGVFYQGFVGDWNLLRPDLLREIRHRFPLAALRPILDDDTGPAPGAFSADLTNLPVRLSVAGIPGGAATVAWKSVRGTLIATWLAAAAVLAVAGWGLRNLVKLTERRMQFAYSVTHELRTPLTTFRLYADMLSAGMVPEESKREYLDTLNTESLRLSKLVEGVLEYARLENQKVNLNSVETDVVALLETVSETLEKRCEETGVSAKTEHAMANGETIRTDVDVVNRIAGVLVNNACRHARDTERAVVLLKLGTDDGKLVLDVIDSGPGIERADARAIFKPFRRGRRAEETAQRGIGLGLALASSWAELLGGRLTLAARHDPELGGAHFRLTIPARQAS